MTNDGSIYISEVESRKDFEEALKPGESQAHRDLQKQFGVVIPSVSENVIKLGSTGEEIKIKAKLIKHTSFHQEAVIASAGMITVTDGEIKSVDNMSGHYKLPADITNVNFQTKLDCDGYKGTITFYDFNPLSGNRTSSIKTFDGKEGGGAASESGYGSDDDDSDDDLL